MEEPETKERTNERRATEGGHAERNLKKCRGVRSEHERTQQGSNLKEHHQWREGRGTEKARIDNRDGQTKRGIVDQKEERGISVLPSSRKRDVYDVSDKQSTQDFISSFWNQVPSSDPSQCQGDRWDSHTPLLLFVEYITQVCVEINAKRRDPPDTKCSIFAKIITEMRGADFFSN